MQMAFGHKWENEDRLRKVCSDVLALSDRPEWKSLELLVKLAVELKREQFSLMRDILDVREAAGEIDGMKKVLALSETCRQVLDCGR